GLILLQRDYGWVGVQSENGVKSIVMVQGKGSKVTASQKIPLTQKTIYLKAECDFKQRADKAWFYYSLDGKTWNLIGSELKMSYTMPHFMGYRFGLFNYATKTTGGYADFDYFR